MARPQTYYNVIKPRVGMVLAFTITAVPGLAGIPGIVKYIWPRFRSGDYLVTLEYAQPVKCGGEIITHIDAFMSELELSKLTTRISQ